MEITQKLRIATHGYDSERRDIRSGPGQKSWSPPTAACLDRAQGKGAISAKGRSAREADGSVRPGLIQITLDCVGPNVRKRLMDVNVDIREPSIDLKARLEFLLAVPTTSMILIYNGRRIDDRGCL